MSEVQDYIPDAVLEGNVPEEAGDVETIGRSKSATPQSNSESSGFDSDSSSTDTPAEAETSSTGETGSDSFPKTDDELVSGSSDEQEAAKAIIYEIRDILDLSGNIRNSSGFITPTRLHLNNLRMFNENRSQYHRLSKYGDSDKPRQWSQCESCGFVTPVFDTLVID